MLVFRSRHTAHSRNHSIGCPSTLSDPRVYVMHATAGRMTSSQVLDRVAFPQPDHAPSEHLSRAAPLGARTGRTVRSPGTFVGKRWVRIGLRFRIGHVSFAAFGSLPGNDYICAARWLSSAVSSFFELLADSGAPRGTSRRPNLNRSRTASTNSRPSLSNGGVSRTSTPEHRPVRYQLALSSLSNF